MSSSDFIYSQFVGLVLLAVFLSYGIMGAVARVGGGSSTLVQLFFLPGVILHELAHAAACVITLTPIKRLSFWNGSGGHLVHAKPRLSMLTQPIISFAPLPAGMTAIAILSQDFNRYNWRLTAIILILMTSIAGTLAPSKKDLTPAVGGILFFAIVAIIAAIYWPEAFQVAKPGVRQLVVTLWPIDGLLGAIWLGVSVLGRWRSLVSGR